MKKIAVIGKNSFMAKAIRESGTGKDWLWLSHDEAFKDDSWLQKTSVVINFAFASQMRKEAYDANLDIDSKIAKLIKNTDIHYIMLSSRMVYGKQEIECFVENLKPNPQNIYGENKLKIEQNLIEILGEDRLTRLRLSNIFGFEPSRKSFFGIALTKLANENRIIFDMSPFTKRDFISVWRFGRDLLHIAQKPKGGVFNLGAGFGVQTGWIAQWLIDSYGKGEFFVSNMQIRDVFWLDMQKTKDVFGMPEYGFEDLEKDCNLCGELMKDYRYEAA